MSNALIKEPLTMVNNLILPMTVASRWSSCAALAK